jgi:hypothetical protein
VIREKRAEVLVVSNTPRPPQKPPPIDKPGPSSKTPPGRKPGPARQRVAATKKNLISILTDPLGEPTILVATSMLKTVSKTQIASKKGPASGKDPPLIGPDPLEDVDTGAITITDSNRTKGTTSTNTTTTTGLLAKKPGPARKTRPATQGELASRQQAPSSQAVSVIQPIPSYPSTCVDKQGPVTSVQSGPYHPSKPASSSVMPTK